MLDPKLDHYIIWCPTAGRSPRVVHQTLEEAMTEAERLARGHKTAKFYVASLAAVVRQAPPPVVPIVLQYSDKTMKSLYPTRSINSELER